VVYDVLSAPEKRVYGVFEKRGIVTIHVKRDGDSTPHFHILYVRPMLLKCWGVGLLRWRGLIPSCRLHPTAKAVGFRLALSNDCCRYVPGRTQSCGRSGNERQQSVSVGRLLAEERGHHPVLGAIPGEEGHDVVGLDDGVAGRLQKFTVPLHRDQESVLLEESLSLGGRD
jgi:hypothetical protein